jgi:putative membrane protein
MEFLISAIIAVIVAAVILIVIDKLNLGLSVGGFLNAIIAAIGIAIVGAIVVWLLGLFNIDVTMSGGIVNAIIYFIVAALAIWGAAKFIPGFETSGYTGAIVAALAIAIIVWLLSLVLGPVVTPLLP